MRSSRLKTLDFETADTIFELIKGQNKELVPGQKQKKVIADGMKICYNLCKKRYDEEIDVKEELEFKPEHEDQGDGPSTTPIGELNASLNAIGVSPVKIQKYAKGQRSNYMVKKQERVAEAVKRRMAEIGDTPTSADKAKSKTAVIEQKARDQDTLCILLKEKVRTSSNQDQIKLLTLAPSSWTLNEVAAYFEVG